MPTEWHVDCPLPLEPKVTCWQGVEWSKGHRGVSGLPGERLWTQAGQVLIRWADLLVWVMPGFHVQRGGCRTTFWGNPSILCVEEEWPRLDGTEHSSCSTDGVSRSLRMSGAKRAICPAGLRAWRLTNTLVSGAGLNSSKSWLCHRSNLCLVAKQTSKSVVLTGRWHESQCEIHPPHKEAQRPGSLGPSQGPSRQ